jgi:hypothetical protein
MKRLLQTSLLPLALVAAIIAPITFTGCSSLSKPTTQQRVVTAAKLAAYVGSSEYLLKVPASKPKFVAASSQLRALAAQTNIDLVSILAIVNTLPVKELKSPQAQIIITAGTLLLSDYAGSLPLDKLNDLKPVAIAMADGIDLATAGSP